MEAHVYIDGKKYRRGYTTGSCSVAAAKAAATMLLLQKTIDYIQIDTPKGIKLTLQVLEAKVDKDYAECAIRKDGGDDIDATHGMLIFAKVRWRKESGIKLLGGQGIGVITEKGLSLAVGEPAINPVPRKMIHYEVSKVVGERGIEIIIFAPEGERIAKKTFNPRLGIVGGISIIGTTGIVEPMSDEGWKRSMSIELEMKRAQGIDKILLVPGNQGERFASSVLKVDYRYVTRMSNFIGYMLMECTRLGYKKIILAGPLGKFIKLAAGIFHTHSRVADGRNEILIAYLALMGAPLEILKQIEVCVTTEAALEVIKKADLTKVYSIIADRCKKRVQQHIREEEIEVEVILFSMAGEELARTEGASFMVEEMK